LAQAAQAAAPVATEKSLLGIRILQSYRDVLKKYGTPTRVFMQGEVVDFAYNADAQGNSTGGVRGFADTTGATVVGGPGFGAPGGGSMMGGPRMGGGTAGMSGAPMMGGPGGMPGGASSNYYMQMRQRYRGGGGGAPGFPGMGKGGDAAGGGPA